MRKMDIEEWAETIDVPVENWNGNCDIIASRFQSFFPDFIVQRGLWVGPIHPDSIFGNRPLSGHSWLGKDDSDEIIDPTRWTFEMVTPYIYEGRRGDEYDENGEGFRMLTNPSFPAFDAPDPLMLDDDLIEQFEKLTGGVAPSAVGKAQVFWLANLSRAGFGSQELCLGVYRALIEAGKTAYIPIDNMNWAKRVGL